jgi:AcrR family transcriptional regulator
MRQEERRARTRAALLKAAAAAFATRGYDGASVDAIAASVNLSKGAVYANFPTKLDLYLGVLGGLVDQAEMRLDRVARSLKSSPDPVLAAQHYFGFGGDTEHASLLADLWRTAVDQPPVRAVLDGYLDRRRALLGRSAIDGGASPGEAMRLAVTIGRLIDGEVLYRRLGEVSAEASS